MNTEGGYSSKKEKSNVFKVALAASFNNRYERDRSENLISKREISQDFEKIRRVVNNDS